MFVSNGVAAVKGELSYEKREMPQFLFEMMSRYITHFISKMYCVFLHCF